MISGWKAGNAIAAAVKEERAAIRPQAVDDYVCWWRSAYVDRYRHEDYLMNFSLPYVIDTGSDLDYIFSLVKDPLPPCWNPYAAITHIGGLMGGLMPRIQQERPDVARKLAGMSRPMTDILAVTTQACGTPDAADSPGGALG